MERFRNLISRFFFASILSLGLIVSAQADVIGVSIPLSGDFSQLGREFRTGANIAMERYGESHSLFIVDDGCDPDLANLAIEDLKAQDPSILTGFLCNEVAISAANQFRLPGTPLLIAGARSIRLIKDRYREEWNLWRMSPGDDYAYIAAAKEIEKRWRAKAYAVVDDGTIFGRAYTDGLRLVLNEAGLEPQLSDNFRAAQSTQAGLLRRMQRTGVDAVFVAAATSEDLFTIARNNSDLNVNLEFIMSEQISVLPYLEDADRVPAGLMVMKPVLPISQERKELDRLLQERDIIVTPQIYAGYAAIQVAIKAIEQGRDQATARLQNAEFQTITGLVNFGADGANITNPYKLHIWDGTRLVLPSIESPATQ